MKTAALPYLLAIGFGMAAIAVLEYKALSMGVDGKCLNAAFLAMGGGIGSIVTVLMNLKRPTKEVRHEEVKHKD